MKTQWQKNRSVVAKINMSPGIGDRPWRSFSQTTPFVTYRQVVENNS